MKYINLIPDVLVMGFTAITIVLVIICIVLYKFNRLYNYFIRSEKDVNSKRAFSIDGKQLPPINSECPSKEELENLD